MQRLVHGVILLPTNLTSINRSVRLKRNWLYQTPLQKVLMKRASFKVEDTTCRVSDAKDITRNRRETSLRYKQFGKGIVKYEACKQNFTLFCSTSEP